MLWALESVGLLAAGALALNLITGSIVYATWILLRRGPRAVRARLQR